MRVKIPDVMFLKAQDKSFKGREGNDVKYRVVSVLLSDGVSFDAPVNDKDVVLPTVASRTTGVAEYEVASKDNKAQLRFVSFVPAKA